VIEHCEDCKKLRQEKSALLAEVAYRTRQALKFLDDGFKSQEARTELVRETLLELKDLTECDGCGRPVDACWCDEHNSEDP